jgi:hypothetical protein
MNANELRIGDYVFFNTNKKPFQITAAGILDMSNYECKNPPFNYEPIALTEEWLVKFGFEKLYSSAIHTTFSNGTILSYYVWHKSGNQYADIYGAKVRCQYVHQLQNLYFALTGLELEVKP